MAEWQVCEDKGFIFKCRKKQCISPAPATLAQSREPILEEAELRVREAMARREEMSILLAQKARYVAEIEDWERLLTEPQHSLNCDSILELQTSSAEHTAEVDDNFEDLHQKHQALRLQLQAFEGFIEQLKFLCDQGEGICEQLELNAENDRLSRGQDLLNEVGQHTPRTIIHALTSDPVQFLPGTPLPAITQLGKLIAE